MSNDAFTQFLISKTVQQYPLREEVKFCSNLEDQNLLLFIKKRIAQFKQKSSDSKVDEFSIKKLSNFRLKPKETTKTSQSPVFNQQRASSLQSSQRSNTHKSTRPTAEAEVAALLNDELLKKQTAASLYKEFKVANLKDNLKKIKNSKQEADFNGLNHIEMEDNEKMSKYIEIVCKQHPNINIGSLLGVKVRKPEMQQTKLQEINRIKKILNLDKDEQLQKEMVQVYQATRYDQFEPQFHRKDKFRMSVFCQRSKMQEQLFTQVYNHEIQQAKTPKPIRTTQPIRSSVKTCTSPQHTTASIRMQTSYFGSKCETEVEDNMRNFMNQLETVEKEQKREGKMIKRKLKFLNKKVAKQTRTLSEKHKKFSEETKFHEEFVEFQNESKFKKKLIQYLLDQAEDKNEILSQKCKQQKTKQLIRRLSQEMM